MERKKGSFRGKSASVIFDDEEDVAKQEPKHNSMFADAAAMKEKLRQSMMKPQYDVCNFYKQKGFCQKVARHPMFDAITLSVIAFNALWMWVDTDLNDSATLLEAHPVFQIAEHFFCAYFTFEWVMRFGAFERKRDGCRDAWFLFDTFMVFMMVAETWVLTGVMLLTGGGGGGGGMGNASILRLLRLLRLSRMARMAKLLRSMPELLILIKGMVSAMRSVFFTLLLLGILLYIFAIAFRQLTDGTPAGQLYFSSVVVSMHTLLRDGTFLDSLGDVISELLNAPGGWALALIFYVFVFLAAATVMNMLIGVLCEVVSAVAATEKESITVSMVKDGFMEILTSGGLDQDGDHKISRREFNSILDHREAVLLLDRVAVDVYALVDLADWIFEPDETGEEKELEFTDFMELILSLRGTNNATVRDIVDLRKFIESSLKKLEDRLEGRSPSRKMSRSPTLESKLEDCGKFTKARIFTAGEETLNMPRQLPFTTGSTKSLSEPVSTWTLPVPDADASHPASWTHAARIQGILAAAASEVERYVATLPADTFAFHDSMLHKKGDEISGLRVGTQSKERLADQSSSALTTRTLPTAASMSSRPVLNPSSPLPPPAVTSPWPAGGTGSLTSLGDVAGGGQAPRLRKAEQRLNDAARQRLDESSLGTVADTISAELGVFTLEDLAYLRPEDLSASSLRPVQRRRLLELIDSKSRHPSRVDGPASLARALGALAETGGLVQPDNQSPQKAAFVGTPWQLVGGRSTVVSKSHMLPSSMSRVQSTDTVAHEKQTRFQSDGNHNGDREREPQLSLISIHETTPATQLKPRLETLTKVLVAFATEMQKARETLSLHQVLPAKNSGAVALH